MENISSIFVLCLGLGTTFFGLICIILLSVIMSAVCRIASGKKSEEKMEEVQNAAPQATGSQIPNRGELVAAISAAVAEEMGTDVSGLRIVSIKKI